MVHRRILPTLLVIGLFLAASLPAVLASVELPNGVARETPEPPPPVTTPDPTATGSLTPVPSDAPGIAPHDGNPPRPQSSSPPEAASTAPTPAPPTPIPTTGTAVADPGPAYFVAPAGNDGGGGSVDAPWATLQHAFDTAAPGSTILVRDGSYSGARLTRSGLAVAAYEGENVVVNGTIEITGVQGAEVRGLIAQGSTDTFDSGILVTESSGVVVAANVVRGNSLGIFMNDVTGSVIEANTITDNAYGMEIHGRTDGTIIRDNTITDNDRYLDPGRSAGGVNFFRTAGGLTFSGNRVTNNNEVAIEIYGANDLLIAHNVMTGSHDLIETGTEQGWSCNNLTIVRNLGFASGTADRESGFYLRCASNSLVAHNTLVGLDRFAFGVMVGGPFGGSIENLRILNNVAVGGRAYSLDACLPGSVTIDYNLVQPAAGPENGDAVAWVACAGQQASTIEALRSLTGYDQHGRLGDPRFIDPASRDYRHGDGSPAIDGAVMLPGINDGFAGGAPDIGRSER